MKLRPARIALFLLTVAFAFAPLLRAEAPAGEYVTHLDALTKLSVAVAESMPADQYDYRPHPESMTFGQLMSHIAVTNFQFCAGLADTATPGIASPTDKAGVVKLLKDSFDYCATVIPKLTEASL